MRMHLETLTGKGKLISDGTEIAVRYRVEIYQEQLSSRSFTGSSTTPGLKSAEITGKVGDFLDPSATYTLVLDDDRRCRVFAQGIGGPNVVVSFTAMKVAELLGEEADS